MRINSHISEDSVIRRAVVKIQNDTQLFPSRRADKDSWNINSCVHAHTCIYLHSDHKLSNVMQ